MAFVRAEAAFAPAELARLEGEIHITRPLAPPYSLHTVLLKVESYNGLEGEIHMAAPAFASWPSICKLAQHFYCESL
jgi:hypothetical protein